MYIILWEFIAREEWVAEFEAVYGPDGKWARLFAESPGYRETRLLRDTTDPLRYVTLDFWESGAAHDEFRREHEAGYQELDKRCARLTRRETRMGAFETSTNR